MLGKTGRGHSQLSPLTVSRGSSGLSSSRSAGCHFPLVSSSRACRHPACVHIAPYAPFPAPMGRRTFSYHLGCSPLSPPARRHSFLGLTQGHCKLGSRHESCVHCESRPRGALFEVPHCVSPRQSWNIAGVHAVLARQPVHAEAALSSTSLACLHGCDDRVT